MNSAVNIEKFNNVNSSFELVVSFAVEQNPTSPRVSVVFSCAGHNRRVPMTTEIRDGKVFASCNFDAGYIFYRHKPEKINISFVYSDGIDNGTMYDSDLVITSENIRTNAIKHFLSSPSKEKKKIITGALFSILSVFFKPMRVRKNRVTFMTNRSSKPTGNLKAVMEAVSDIDGIDVRIICVKSGVMGVVKRFYSLIRLYYTSRIIFVDDYFHLASYVSKKDKTKLIQLWHGCGAFKTFGFSRYHKDSALDLSSSNHRQYDYAVVSSEDIIDYYAEAFGIDRERVLPLGSPRCDILTKSSYQGTVKNRFYFEYPNAIGKKILLFAPTFRGNGNGDCYYPTERFDVDKLLEALGDEWLVAVKLHPYLKEKITCSEKNRHRMLDCAGKDVNNLLIVADVLVTDYSSVIFEAALLDKPMISLAFDLDDYIEKRDFYLDFKRFVPAVVVKSCGEIADIVLNEKYDMQKIKAFKQRFFGETMGIACDNVRALVEKIISEE